MVVGQKSLEMPVQIDPSRRIRGSLPWEWIEFGEASWVQWSVGDNPVEVVEGVIYQEGLG
jgi:hypothetical protein